MIVVAWIVLLALGVGAVTARARARRRQADRWAKLVGIERMPHETSDELVRRAAARMRITR